MTKVMYALAILLLTACRNTAIPDNIEYRIISETPHDVLGKDNIDILLSREVDRVALKEIALSIRQSRMKFEKVWIFYYLPNMERGSGAWAITHFTPGLELEIIGQPDPKDQRCAGAYKKMRLQGAI